MFNKTLEVNDEGKIMNLFQPININMPDVAWYCNDILCNIITVNILFQEYTSTE